MEKIIDVEYADEMEQSYMDYSMSVIIARAIPGIDGFKPVQRRILYDMHENGLRHDKPHKKSARIVGSTMGKYHPHGDSSIYDALTIMSQDWKKEEILIDGHGNLGNIESGGEGANSTGAAAMRYTECRLSKFAEDVFLTDLNKEIVPFVPNYDGTEIEPSYLPAKLPNFLINGSSGIAVGMVSSAPTHATSEVVDALIALIHNPKLTTKDLMQYIKGPDFPTGGIVDGSNLESIYESGTGKFKIRGRIEIEDLKNGKKNLVITEIPYTMIGAGINKFLCDVVSLAENKEIDLADISNQIGKDGVRLVLELKKDADVEQTKAVLYKKTKLEDTFGVNMLVVLDGKPTVLGLKQILEKHIEFQYGICRNKYTYLLTKEQDKKEVQEGLIKACDVIDLIIEVLRGAKTVKDAKECLMYGEISNITLKTKKSQEQASKLTFTERQAQAILEMRLQKLIGLELDALKKEYEQSVKNITKYEKYLNNRNEMMKVIVEDLEKIKNEYGRPRRTVITDIEEVVIEEKKIEEAPVVVLMDRFGYTRTVDASVYEKNKAAADSENKYVIPCMNTSKLCLFTDVGKMHQIKVLDLPYGNFRAKGTPIDNVSKYDSAEENMLLICSEEDIKDKKLLFSTKMGILKKVDSSEFMVAKKTIAATKLNEDDTVLSIQIIDDKAMVVLQTRDGYFLKFAGTEIPEKKKGAVGVRGIKLQKDDVLENVHLYVDEIETKITYKEKELTLNRLKTAKRDGVGNKQK